MQQRYYDPVIGRFYSNDPVDMLGHMQKGNPTMGFNRYAYANNNPYKYTDPDGRYLFPITSGTGDRSTVDTKPMTSSSSRGSGDVNSTLDTTSTAAGIAAVALIPLLPESAPAVATAKVIGIAAGVSSAAMGENPKEEVGKEVVSGFVGGKVAEKGAGIIKGAAQLDKFSGPDKAVDVASEVVGNSIGDAIKNKDEKQE
ncbi:MAG: RHS repeat-associated core domain-containing protein [Gammaproteobacteria bacterium]|nr:RHS repeat-associated core domain-containing protein [Gammaproteobacteria bacterium]